MSVKQEKAKKYSDDLNNNLDDLVYTIKPTLITEMFFGIFRFYSRGLKIIKPNVIMKIFSILIPSSFVALFAVFLKLPTAITGSCKLMDAIEDLPSMIILLQYVTSAFTTAFVFSATNIKIVLAFKKLDNALHLNITKGFYATERKCTFFLLGFLLLFHILFSAIDLWYHNDISPINLVVLPIYFIQDLEIVIFYKMITMLNNRLDVVNDYLRKYIQAKDEKFVRVFMIPKHFQKLDNVFPTKNIKDLANTYDVIGETCSWINTVFNFQIFMTLVSTFTYVIITIWTSLYYFKSPEDSTGSLLNIIIWCVRCVFTVAVMCFACERLLLVRNNTKVLVNEVVMDYNLDNEIRLQAKAFMELIEAWPLRIVVYDMFSVDITLILKFVNVATTYLIVIIQISHLA